MTKPDPASEGDDPSTVTDLEQPASADDEISISFSSADAMIRTFGPQDLLLRVLEGVYPGLRLSVRGETLTVSGPAPAVRQTETIVDELHGTSQSGVTVSADVIEQTVSSVRQAADPTDTSARRGTESIVSSRGRTIRPKTINQQSYVEAIDHNTIIFGLGPAGTGKTYLAMAKAVQALQAREVNRIILTRPAVEAGESLGYLPGSLNEKIDPYLRPLYDALHDMIEPESIPHLMEAGTIEVAPLAYMRGRTLNDAFIILDEAQNTTGEQMKMFLTRLGFNSHMVITGDTSQVDLPRNTDSGLAQAVEYLEGIEDIAVVRLTSSDVVRHRLVSKIVDAYQEQQDLRGTGASRPAHGPRNTRRRSGHDRGGNHGG